MLVHPRAELPTRIIKKLKRSVKAALLAEALTTYPATNAADWHIREAIFGDDDNDTDWVDVDSKTDQTSGMEDWAQDAADLTDYDLANTVKATYTVPTEKFISFFGIVDRDQIPDLISIAFKGGGQTRAFFQCEHLYAYRDPVGFFDQPPMYSQKDPCEVHMCFKRGTRDHFVKLKTYICERYGKIIAPPS